MTDSVNKSSEAIDRATTEFLDERERLIDAGVKDAIRREVEDLRRRGLLDSDHTDQQKPRAKPAEQ